MEGSLGPLGTRRRHFLRSVSIGLGLYLLAPLGGLHLLGAGLFGSEQVGQTSRPVFRSSTAHVTMDVVVTDGNDRPITDLTRDEFEVRQSGRPQLIDQFEPVRTPLADRAVTVGSTY